MSDSPASPLTLRLFGPIEVRLEGAPLARLRSRKGLWLLALLALRGGAPLERSWLAATLWPDSDETLLDNLRKSLVDLRAALGPQKQRLYSPTPRTLALELAGAEVDVLAFDLRIARGDTVSLDEAVALYRGSLLEGCTEEWVFPERAAREQAYLGALERLAAAALEQEEMAAAERHLRRVVAVEPTRESAHRALMETAAAQGNHAGVTQQYRELRLLLHRELNAEPAPETKALYDALRRASREQAAVGARLLAPGAGVILAPGPDRKPSAASQAESQEFRDERDVTLTFLFTDIEGSTRLMEQHPAAMRLALARHDAILTDGIEQHGGEVISSQGEGDSFFAVFRRATDALNAACFLQRDLQAEPWPAETPLKVRMALHTGEAEQRGGNYYGVAVNRCARLRAAGHGGQVLLSQATCELVRDHLPEGTDLRDLGSHRLKDLQRPEQIFQLVDPSLPAEFPPLHSLEMREHNLPLSLTSFIGRESEIAAIHQILDTSRLVTLIGAGGSGKTRLALQVAADLVEQFAQGVWWVELAPLVDPSLVASQVAAALGVREAPGVALDETLREFLRSRQVLLVLDNCEHLIAACAEFAESLLRACGRVRILATSRERLSIAGEAVYRVPSLSLPEPGSLLPPEQLQQYEAVRLFAERAAQSLPSFAVTEKNATTVLDLCRQLDGIPLAIELAAARLQLLGLEQVAARLSDRFRLLVGGSRTALRRQQTLRAALDWSYDLLSEPEQALLRRLSVFVGGFTLEAAEAVCADDALRTTEVLDLLEQLVNKSLVVLDEVDGEPRYRLLEMIREYGQEKLLAVPEAPPLRFRHRDWFLELAERASPELQGRNQGEWLTRLEREHGNMRAALTESLATGAAGDAPAALAALRLGGSLATFWYVRGYWEEGRRRLTQLLALDAAKASTAERARALIGAGRLVQALGDRAEAWALWEESLAIWRALGQKDGIATALHNLGGAAAQQGDYDRARSLWEESLTLRQALGDRGGMASTLTNMGIIATQQGDPAKARSLWEESLAIQREMGDRSSAAATLNNLGTLAFQQGDRDTARALWEESLTAQRDLENKPAIAYLLNNLGVIAQDQDDPTLARHHWQESLGLRRELGDRRGIAIVLNNLGNLASREGDHATADILYRESLALLRELGDRPRIAEGLVGLGAVAGAIGQPERAARLFASAEALRESLGAPQPPSERAEVERHVAAVRAQLGEHAFAEAWAEGRTIPMDRAVAVALDESKFP